MSGIKDFGAFKLVALPLEDEQNIQDIFAWLLSNTDLEMTHDVKIVISQER